MPKLIFTSRYLKDAPAAQLENYVRYIGTREGVEKIDESKLSLPATGNQRQLITKLIRDIPQTKELLEYTDFLLKPTIGNASELISRVLEQNVDLIGSRRNYVDYLANRPRVERVGEHGLFTDAGEPVILKKVQEDVAQHKGPVWTHVISLRREDAQRLGYDCASQWVALLRSKRAMLCRHMKIDSANLRWYAAFHNEGHHPHVHLMVYSAKENDGYLTKPSIEAMRSELAHDIFRQDFANLYEEQNQAREELKSGAEDVLRQKLEELKNGVLVNDRIERKMITLSERLQNTSGKKVYGYLKRDVKNLVDQIVDELEKDKRMSELYQAWGKWQNEILLAYRNDPVPLPPLSKQKQFKSIKNMVIAEALKLDGYHFSFEDAHTPESEEDWEPEEASERENLLEPDDLLEESELQEEGEVQNRQEAFHADWTKQYKLARKYLYGGNDVEQDFSQALVLFLAEAKIGNALAMYDLGRMCADGLGCEADPESAKDWYRKALTAFLAAERTAEEWQPPYLWYRIGKMYAAGLGTEHKGSDAESAGESGPCRDYASAAAWFSKAVSQNHKYAQYSLAGLYYRGQGVEQDFFQAFLLYQLSAKQGNPYASYELAKMLRDGISTDPDPWQAKEQFEKAFTGFSALERESHDDKLQYRLGWMFHTGTGTEKDEGRAAEYWKQAARLGNIHAQYALGKLWLANGAGDPKQAVEWIEKAVESGNGAAQYALAKIYRDGEHVSKDIGKAVGLFTLSAEQGNEYAAYQLGKLYLAGEEIPKDVQAAVRWMKVAAEKGNSYARYALGKLYLCGKDVPYDKEKAIFYLQASAEQGNMYAQILLEHMGSFHNPSAFLAATQLLRRLEKLFQEDYRKGTGGISYHIDRKRRRKLAEKKQAQGHKRDDHETVQQVN